MRRLLAICLLGLATASLADTTLHLASDEWCPYVCTTGGQISGGYLVDLVNRALSGRGYQIQSVLLPFNRAIRKTEQGDIEGVYVPPEDKRLANSIALYASRSCFYTRRDNHWQFRGMASLQGTRIGIIDDYAYDGDSMTRYIQAHHDNRSLLNISFGETAGQDNLRQMLAGIYPVMLEHEAVARELILRQGAGDQIRQAGCLRERLPLRIGFTRTGSGQETWRHDLAEGIREMEAAGEAKALREHYGLP